ncbi:MAG: exodeoxyribonuclease VII large subunit [bacterium]
MNELRLEQGKMRVYSVSELTRMIRGTLEAGFPSVCVEGELSNVRQPASGHCYFTVKDATAQIRAVIWRGERRGMPVMPRDGMMVRAFGTLTVYDRDGSYQLVVRRMEEGGKGALQAAFEELKLKLAAEGLFDATRKQPLPLLPRHIGVVTSPTGAAIRDILNVLGRRFHNLHVVVAPVRVQGEGAAAEIAAAIDLLNRRGGLDVLIVGRGGGSMEDLWCFNEECVARAVARSGIPIISAVGHEIDFTICDFVADLRAPTPSAAAELVVGLKGEFSAKLARQSQAMRRLLRQAVLEAKNRFTAAAGSYVFREPAHAAKAYRQKIDRLRLQSRHLLERRFQDSQQRADDLSMRMVHGMRIVFTERAHRVQGLERQLTAYNPLAVLKRGYSITFNRDGRAIRRAGDVQPGEEVCTRVGSGEFSSEVRTIKSE